MATVEDVQFRFNVTGNAIPQMKAVQNQMGRLHRQVRAGTRQVHDYSRANEIASTSTRKWAKGAMQQAGYQVGDFVVQVQNGTNAMQAFGQQGAQLAGIFGPIGAVIGAGIAIFSSLAIVFQKAMFGAKEVKDEVMDLSAALDAVEGSAKTSGEAFQRYLTDTFEGSERQINSLLGRLETLRLVNLSQALGGLMSDAALPIAEVRAEFDRLTTSISENQKLMDVSPGAGAAYDKAIADAKEFSKQVGLSTNEFQIFLDNMDRIKKAPTFDQIVAEIARMDEHLQSVTGGSGPLEEFRNKLVKIMDGQGIFTRLGQEAADSAKAYEPLNNTLDQIVSKLDRVGNIRDQLAKDAEVILDPRDPRYNKIAAIMAQMNDEAKKIETSAGGGASKAAAKINSTLSPELQRLADLQKSVSTSFERGFDSIIDGTGSVKDAFKAMAGDIIKELYRIFVVKKITGFLENAFGAIFGGLMGLGGPATSLRPMARPPGLYTGGTASGQRPHIVGEKGPELFIPSRTGQVVANNKMGGGGGVTVIQNNTFGNGVSRGEINAMLPKMVEATKAAVVDAKLRGGSYGRSFA